MHFFRKSFLFQVKGQHVVQRILFSQGVLWACLWGPDFCAAFLFENWKWKTPWQSTDITKGQLIILMACLPPHLFYCVYMVDSFIDCSFPLWGIWKILEAIEKENSDYLKQTNNKPHNTTLLSLILTGFLSAQI